MLWDRDTQEGLGWVRDPSLSALLSHPAPPDQRGTAGTPWFLTVRLHAGPGVGRDLFGRLPGRSRGCFAAAVSRRAGGQVHVPLDGSRPLGPLWNLLVRVRLSWLSPSQPGHVALLTPQQHLQRVVP